MTETDERSELQRMLGPLPVDEIYTLPNGEPSTVMDEIIVLQDDCFQRSRDQVRTSLEIAGPKTSLEILECAHRRSQINVNSNVVIRDHSHERLRGSLSIGNYEEASGIPLPPTSSDDLSSSHPSSAISSPLSSSGLNDVSEGEEPIDSFTESYNLYKNNNIRLSKHFPHLLNVCSGSRLDEANIRIFDYTGNVLRNVKHQSFDFKTENSSQPQDYTSSKLDECRHFICPIDSSQIETRLVLVEDLGPTLINLLGAMFDLSPEFFEEHLYRSDYRGSGASGVSPLTWRTSNLRKNYVSLAWSRPGEYWATIEQDQWENLLGHNPACVEAVTQFEDKRGQTSNVYHEFVAKTNIFRLESEMSANSAGILPEKYPCGLEERATVCSIEHDGLQYVILLLDPIPLLKKTTTGIADAMRPVILQGERKIYRASNCKSRSKPTHVSARQEDWYRQIEIQSSFTQKHCRTPWNLDYHSLFSRPKTNRAALKKFDPLSPFQSTTEALQNWLVSAPISETKGYRNRLGPGSMVFRIAHQDTMGLLQLMRSVVTEIDQASNDIELQETALQWRCRLDEFRALLIDLESSLRSFVDFLYTDEPAASKNSPPKLDTDPIGYLLNDALGAIELHEQRITQVYSSLTSKTQISDSHRSIAEAETVTRLTELAFLFIPLSFSTSIFGMQFVSGSTSATTYIAVALALTSGAYLLRFIINRTTEQRSNLERSISYRITAYAKLRPGSRIPTRTFVQWLVHVVKQYLLRFWQLSFLGSTALIMLVIPLPIIWTSSLNMGLQIALSCLLISIPTIFVASYYGARYRQRLAKARDGSSA